MACKKTIVLNAIAFIALELPGKCACMRATYHLIWASVYRVVRSCECHDTHAETQVPNACGKTHVQNAPADRAKRPITCLLDGCSREYERPRMCCGMPLKHSMARRRAEQMLVHFFNI